MKSSIVTCIRAVSRSRQLFGAGFLCLNASLPATSILADKLDVKVNFCGLAGPDNNYDSRPLLTQSSRFAGIPNPIYIFMMTARIGNTNRLF